jgi:transposase
MTRFIEAEDRTQSALFPEQLDDWIAEDNPVRVIDVFVDELDLEALGFDRAQAAATGRPGYHPATLLKIYIYGYLNRVQSSRRLEREAQRNLELIWLTGRLAPDFKTIADFRKDNGAAIRQVCRQFIELSRSLDLFSEAIVAIDGSKFKAVNNRNKNFTAAKLQATLRLMQENIDRYLDELDRADRQPESLPEGRVAHLKEKIATAKARMRKLGQIGRQLQQSPNRQVSLTDPDARSMANSGSGTAVVGYNVQIAVDTKHHLIVAEEVTNAGHDRAHLAEMARQAKGAVGEDELTVLADRGYFDSEEILHCVQEGIAALVPKPLTSNSKAEGRFDKRDFVYDAKRDEYRCPAGERAIWRMTRIEGGLRMHRYWPSACPSCPIKSRCTPSNQRRIWRWEHEHVLEAMQARLDRTPSAARLRRRTVEHVFGTIKAWMGATHFLTRTLSRVRTEMSLHVLAYNLRRLMSLLGVAGVIAVMKA